MTFLLFFSVWYSIARVSFSFRLSIISEPMNLFLLKANVSENVWFCKLNTKCSVSSFNSLSFLFFIPRFSTSGIIVSYACIPSGKLTIASLLICTLSVGLITIFFRINCVNCFKTVSDFWPFSFFFFDWKFSDSLLIYIHCLVFAAATQVLKIKKCLLCKSQFDNDEKLKSYNYNFHNVDGENYFFKRQFEKKARCKFSPRLWLRFFKRQNLRNCMIS